MDLKPILQTWGRALTGRKPSLSLEITRECPLRCPGCYAYEDHHLGEKNLRSLADFKGEELIRGVLRLVDEHKPLHLSIVGGDPLVRYREVDALLPALVGRGIHVQVVTSAFRQIPAGWAKLPRLRVAVSVDGLAPEHDVRRKPATYERILRNIEGQRVAIHCTITSALLQRPGYLREFVEFWSRNPNAERIWMSVFTPQQGAEWKECLSAQQRGEVVSALLELRKEFPKLDMREGMIREFLSPPASPARCIFARTTHTVSADLKTIVTPCQFGGSPDCSQCGCIASMGLAAIGNHRVAGRLTAGDIFFASANLGDWLQKLLKRFGCKSLRSAPGAAQRPALTTIAAMRGDSAAGESDFAA